MAFIFRCDRCNVEMSGYVYRRFHIKIEDKNEDTVKEADLCEDCKNVIELTLIPPPRTLVESVNVAPADDDSIPF